MIEANHLTKLYGTTVEVNENPQMTWLGDRHFRPSRSPRHDRGGVFGAVRGSGPLPVPGVLPGRPRSWC